MKTAKEKVKDFVMRNYEKEKEKWEMGERNTYFQWEEVKEELFSDIDTVSVSYANGLEEEIKRLKKLLDVYHINY